MGYKYAIITVGFIIFLNFELSLQQNTKEYACNLPGIGVICGGYYNVGTVNSQTRFTVKTSQYQMTISKETSQASEYDCVQACLKANCLQFNYNIVTGTCEIPIAIDTTKLPYHSSYWRIYIRS